MLTPFDDYPIHQTSEPLTQPASSDRHVYDRYWFNGYRDDGAFYFGVSAALYPNLGIMDCGLSIAIDGEQHAFHGSRRAPAAPPDLPVLTAEAIPGDGFPPDFGAGDFLF